MKSNLKLWQLLIVTFLACCVLYWFFGPHQFKVETAKEEVKTPVKFGRVTIIPTVMDMDIIVDIESSGNPDTPDSPAGARGLCQIMPKTWAECTKRMGVDWSFEVDAHDAEKNLAVGTWYMNYRIPQMIKYYKIEDNFKNRIIAYSWGIGKLCKYDAGEITELRKETSDYINKYINRYMFKETINDFKKEASRYTAEEWRNRLSRG